MTECDFCAKNRKQIGMIKKTKTGYINLSTCMV